ncbi:MAG: hypothetical protein QM479_05345 [Pseudomonadota bacterium]
MLNLGGLVSANCFNRCKEKAIKVHHTLINRSYKGPSYNDFRVKYESLCIQSSKGELAKSLKFKHIEHIPSEIHLRHGFRSFYKKVIRKQCHNIEDLENITKKTGMRICAHSDIKTESVVCFSALILYFCYYIGVSSIKSGEVDFYLNIATYLARITLLGEPEEFLNSFKHHYNYNIDELSEHGVLKSSILRHYIIATEGADKAGHREGRFILSGERKIPPKLFSGIPFELVPESGSFIIRTENIIAMVRDVGVNQFKKKEYSYIQIPVDKDSHQLQFLTWGDYKTA